MTKDDLEYVKETLNKIEEFLAPLTTADRGNLTFMSKEEVVNLYVETKILGNILDRELKPKTRDLVAT